MSFKNVVNPFAIVELNKDK